jgi:hypothetical protein
LQAQAQWAPPSHSAATGNAKFLSRGRLGDAHDKAARRFTEVPGAAGVHTGPESNHVSPICALTGGHLPCRGPRVGPAVGGRPAPLVGGAARPAAARARPGGICQTSESVPRISDHAHPARGRGSATRLSRALGCERAPAKMVAPLEARTDHAN